jgi:hypothetical protein
MNCCPTVEGIMICSIIKKREVVGVVEQECMFFQFLLLEFQIKINYCVHSSKSSISCEHLGTIFNLQVPVNCTQHVMTSYQFREENVRPTCKH